MADSKKIIFEASLDTSSFGPAIEQIKKKLDQVSQSQAQNSARMSQQSGGIMGGSIPKAEEIYKTIRALEVLQNFKKNAMRDSEKELAIEKEKLTIQKEMARLRGGAVGASGGGGGGGGASLRGADWSGVTPPGFSGMATKIVERIGGAAAVLGAASVAIERIAGYPMRIEQAKGSAVQSFIGRDIQAAQRGEAKFETPWLGERARAAEMAETKRHWNQISDIGQGLAGVGLIIAGLTTGAAALMGTPLTLGGSAAVGLPAAGAMLTAGGAALYSDRARSAILDPAGHKRLLEAQQGQDLMSTWEALKQQNPQKGAAIERLRSRYAGDIQTQRLMGLSDQGLMGFQTEANMGGFNEDMRAAMAVQMQGAGGSTAGMGGRSSMLALQAQRGFNLTNAGGVMGRLTGAIGGGEAGVAQSEQLFRRIMEESITVGLNKSDMVEEQRRFTDVTSEIISRTGTTTAEGASRIAEDFAKYLGGGAPSIRGIEGARSAYEQMQAATAETGGRGGALQFASIMQNPNLSKIDPDVIGNLMGLPTNQMTGGSSDIAAVAKGYGYKGGAEGLARDLRKAKMGGLYATIGVQQGMMEDLQSYMKESGVQDLNQPGAIDNMDQQHAKQLAQLKARIGYKFDVSDPFQRNALAMRMIQGEDISGAAAGAGQEYERKMAGGTGRAADDVIAASGVEAQKLLNIFARYKDEITPSTVALAQFLDMIISVKTAASVNQSGAMDRYNASVPAPLRGQVQAGKSAPGIFGMFR